MSEQIDLGKLRGHAEHVRDDFAPPLNERMAVLTADVLALIEAVEAAHHLLAVFEWDPDDEPEARALNAALRRFTGWQEPA